MKYVDYRTKVIIRCHEHGDFEQTPDCHYVNNGCPLCYQDQITVDIYEYIEKAKDILFGHHEVDIGKQQNTSIERKRSMHARNQC